MILIVSHTTDRHAITVRDELLRREEKVLLLDYADYPTEWQVAICISGTPLVRFDVGGKAFNGDQVKMCCTDVGGNRAATEVFECGSDGSRNRRV